MQARQTLLLVDDGQRVLQGLRRMLREQAEFWDLHLAVGGQEALSLLGQHEFDLVAVGSRMQGIDGRDVLEKVCETQPNAVRLLMVNEGEIAEAVRSTSVAHRVVARPKRAEPWIATLERSLALKALLDDVHVRGLANGLRTLPSAPDTYLAIRAAAADPDVSVRTVAEIVEQDVALSARILQLVNSSVFGLAQETSSIQHAASHLGIDMLRNICLSSEMFTKFEGELPPGFNFEEQRSHANRVSQLLVHIVPDERQRERAVLAAFLHDIGTLVQVTQMPDDFRRIHKMDEHAKMPLADIERRVLGVNHAELGAYVLGLWGMPFDLVEAVAFHHEPSRARAREFGILGWVHVADTLIEELDGVPLGGKPSQLDAEFLRTAGIDPDEVQLWRQVAGELDPIAGAA